MSAGRETAATDLVLVGGGHAHVQVLRRFMMRPEPGLRLTVVLDRPDAVYSGMVPAFVAGELPLDALEIDVVPLARRAGARVVLAAAQHLDPVARTIHCEGRPALRYDVASLDLGSSVRGLELPGVAEHALATRPIRDFADALERRLEKGPSPIVVVGVGSAGVELALTIQGRLARAGARPSLSLVGDGDTILPGSGAALQRAVRRELDARGIELVLGAQVDRVAADHVVLGDGQKLASGLTVWATGAAPNRSFDASALPTDAAGFVRVRDTLEVEGVDGLFAVGDGAAFGPRALPKAGVYAVRQGPILDRNLRAFAAGRARTAYRPQRDFLSLLHLGDGRAAGGKWGLAARGAWLHRWKDGIDRRFMRRFQVLDTAGADAERFPTPEAMGMEEMPCGGCAAKVSATPLSRALGRLPKAARDERVVLGLDTPDDAAALRRPDGSIALTSVDGFRAFADDPYLVGRVAALNAMNDLWAKGGRIEDALAWVNVPDDDPERAEETLFQVLSGVRASLDASGVTLLGGHTTQGETLQVGLAVNGVVDPPAKLLPAGGARPGDALVLSRGLGTGVLLAADMQGRARGRDVQATYARMLRPGRGAAALFASHPVRAATDVSGFGLGGHLSELVLASGASAVVALDAIPMLPGVEAMLRRGLRSSYHDQNATLRKALRLGPGVADDPRLDALFDPQTAGGFLVALPADAADAFVAALQADGEPDAARIGRVDPPRSDGAHFAVVVRSDDADAGA